jgi:hypothetical protein
MRIFTKKAFEFTNSEGGSVVTAPLSFHEVPDWCAGNQMFKWGKADGDIEVIGEEKKLTKAERIAAAKAAKEAAEKELAENEQLQDDVTNEDETGVNNNEQK